MLRTSPSAAVALPVPAWTVANSRPSGRLVVAMPVPWMSRRKEASVLVAPGVARVAGRVAGGGGGGGGGGGERIEKSAAFVPEMVTLARLRVALEVLVMVKERVIWPR